MTLDTLIDRLAPVAYPAMLESYRPDCCVAAAAILMHVFRECGYRAGVITVTVEIYNAAMVDLLERDAIPSDREEKLALLESTGAWGVGIVPPSYPIDTPLRDTRRPMGGGYGGHLLLCVNQFLVDATIMQAQRVEKDIRLPLMLWSNQAKALLCDGNLFLGVNNCAVVYRRIKDDSYRAAPDWQRRTTPYPETVRKILERIK